MREQLRNYKGTLWVAGTWATWDTEQEGTADRWPAQSRRTCPILRNLKGGQGTCIVHFIDWFIYATLTSKEEGLPFKNSGQCPPKDRL